MSGDSIIRFGWDGFHAALAGAVDASVAEVASSAGFSRAWTWAGGRELEIYVRRSTEAARASYPAKTLNAEPCPFELGDTCFIQAFHRTLIWTHHNLELFLSGGSVDELAGDARRIQALVGALPLSDEPAPSISASDDVIVCELNRPSDASVTVVGSLGGYTAVLDGRADLLDFTPQSVRFVPTALGRDILGFHFEDPRTLVSSNYVHIEVDCRAGLAGPLIEIAPRYHPNTAVGANGELMERPDEDNTTWMVHEVSLPSATVVFAFFGPIWAAAPRALAMTLTAAWLDRNGQRSILPAEDFAVHLGHKDSDLSGALVVDGQEYRLRAETNP